MKKLFGALIIALSLMALFSCGNKLAIENLLDIRYTDDFKDQTVYKAELKLKSGKDFTLTISGKANDAIQSQLKIAELFAKKTLTASIGGKSSEITKDASFGVVIAVSVDQASSSCGSDSNANNKYTLKSGSEEYTLDFCLSLS